MTLLSSSAPTIHYQHAFMVDNNDRDGDDDDDNADDDDDIPQSK